MTSPPRDLPDLTKRAAQLAGVSLRELFLRAERDMPELSARSKGKVGELLEQVLGATAGSRPVPDFPELGVELKTLPLDDQGRPRESTFVCSLSLVDADRLEWSDSPVRSKLAHVLWVPILGEGAARQVGSPFFWRPTEEQEAVLRADFEEIVGMIAIGQVEALTAHIGEYLQARPKASHSHVRTRAYGEDDEPIEALPRGFYLRAKFTRELVAAQRKT